MFKYGQKVKHLFTKENWTFVGIDPRNSQKAVIVKERYPPFISALDNLEPVRESKGFIVVGIYTPSNLYKTYAAHPVTKETAEEVVKNNVNGDWVNLQIVEVFE